MDHVAFPVALDLRGKRCVVVGGGAVGRRRARSLADAGALVEVVDPKVADLPPGVAATAARFAPEHLDGAFLVVVATDSPSVNDAVIRAARERNVLVNAAAPGTEGDSGDFSVMTTLHRGPVAVGICGAGPGVAKMVRERIDQCLEPWIAEWACLMDRARSQVQDRVADEDARRFCLGELVASDSIRTFVAGGQLHRAAEQVETMVDRAAKGVLPCRT